MLKVSGYTDPHASWNGSLSQGVKKYDRYWGPNRVGLHDQGIGGYDGITYIATISFNFKIKHKDTSVSVLWGKEGLENFGGAPTLVAWSYLRASNSGIVFDVGKFQGGKYSSLGFSSSLAAVAIGEWADFTLVIDLNNSKDYGGVIQPHPYMYVYKNGTLVEVVGNTPNVWTGDIVAPGIYIGEPWIDLKASEGSSISHTGIAYFFQNYSSRPTSTLNIFRVWNGTITAEAAAANVRAPSAWEFLAGVSEYPHNYQPCIWEFSIDNYAFVPIPALTHNPPGFQNFGEVFGYGGTGQDPVYMWYGLDEGPSVLGDAFVPPTLLYPTNLATGSEINTYFEWGGVYGADSYVLQTCPDNLFVTNVRTRYTAGLSYVMNDPPFDMSTSYYWRAAVIVGAVTGSAFSSPYLFTTGNFLNFNMIPTISKVPYHFGGSVTKSTTLSYPIATSSGSIV